MNLRQLSWRDCRNFRDILQVGSRMSGDGVSTIL
jgi:hypothetical protein